MAALAVSFWDVCLDNLPEGGFTRRRLTTEAARTLIDEAKEAGQLLCVSADDLAAPYKKDALEKCRELCDALAQRYGIRFSLDGFFIATGEGAETIYSITPLQCVEVSTHRPLLVVTCNYEFADRDKDRSRLRFQIATETIGFHLIEAIS